LAGKIGKISETEYKIGLDIFSIECLYKVANWEYEISFGAKISDNSFIGNQDR